MQIAILIYPGLTSLDAIGPFEILRWIPDAEIRLVWKELGPVVTDSGVLVVGATHTLAETPAPDVVLVPGSSGDTGTLMQDAEVLAWIREAHESTRWTTSVCSGSLILAAAGLLEGHPATSHWAGMRLLKRFGAQPRPKERMVRSGKLWTAAGVSAGLDLAFALAAELTDRETAEVIQLIIEYDPQPPFDAGHMGKASPAVRARARRDMLKASLSVRGVLALSKALLARWMHVLTRRRRPAPLRGEQQPGADNGGQPEAPKVR